MWLSTAMLICSEVEAAVYEQALYSDCGHPGELAHDSGGGHKTPVCFDIDEPAPASTDNLAAPIARNPAQPVPVTFVSSYVFSSLPVLLRRSAFRAAPPSIAVYLRNSRLLI